MMTNKKAVSKIYNSQNIAIRRSIRQIDMEILNSGGIQHNNDVNILVLGSDEQGKKNLLKTFFYALNGTLAYTIESEQIGTIVHQRYEIKKNKKYAVEGLSKVKETDSKLGITGHIIRTLINPKNPIQQYSRSIEIIGDKTFGCLGKLGLNASINYILICLSMVQKISKQELFALKFFASELVDRKIKLTIVGTQMDKITNNEMRNLQSSLDIEQEKAIYIQNWKSFIIEEIGGGNKNLDVYCIQCYSSFKKETFENCEMINYYSLNLLQQITREVRQAERQKMLMNKKGVNKLLCFCG